MCSMYIYISFLCTADAAVAYSEIEFVLVENKIKK